MSVLERLYRQQDHWVAPELPGAAGRVFARADIGDDQIVGLGVWLIVGFVIALIAGLASNPWLGVGLLAAVLLLPVGLLIRWSGRRSQRVVDALPATVDLIARSLRSGASLSQALHEASDQSAPLVASELRQVVAEVARGQTMRAALQSWVVRSEANEVRLVAAALALAAENEVGSTRALEGVSQSLRDRRALHAEIRALTSQASASLRAMVLLPVAFVGLDALSTQVVVRFLFGEPFGRLCLAAGLGLEAVGWLWMRALVQRQMP